MKYFLRCMLMLALSTMIPCSLIACRKTQDPPTDDIPSDATVIGSSSPETSPSIPDTSPSPPTITESLNPSFPEISSPESPLENPSLPETSLCEPSPESPSLETTPLESLPENTTVTEFSPTETPPEKSPAPETSPLETSPLETFPSETFPENTSSAEDTSCEPSTAELIQPDTLPPEPPLPESIPSLTPHQKCQEAFSQQNQLLSKHGVPALQWSESLYQIASQRAVEISSHYSHDGCPDWIGENILVGTNDPSMAIRIWYDSDGHRANMLAGWTYGAIATHGNYWVAVFAMTETS